MTTPPNATPDFERYARTASHVEGRFAFPDAFVDALRGRSGTFLDLGCGDGAVLRSAFDQGLLEPFRRIVAADVSTLRVERLDALALPRTQGVVSDAAPLPLANGSVDVLFSHQVIEHVPDDAAFAREVARVLAPGGIAFVTSVAKRPYGWYFYRCNGRWTLDPTHVREYRDVAQLASRFERAGLAVASAVERPLGHPLDKIVLRAFERTRVVRAGRGDAFFRDARVMRALRGRELRVPGYRYVEVLGVKSRSHAARTSDRLADAPPANVLAARASR